jgi:23S rRNA pseudouridine2604 synthase
MAARAQDDSISLNKYIADTGFCSRREADSYIAQGRVTINDRPAITGNRVRAGDVVEIDGEPIGRKKATIYIAYHKPTGITSTTDTKDRTNIIDAIGHRERIFPIGRLDKDSEGLIFLTNDGNIVNKILRAGNEHEKEYVVTVDKPIHAGFIAEMAGGVRILDTVTKPCKVVQEGRSTFRITLTQGLNRQIRRMCSALGYEVARLKRVRIMNVRLGKLPQGHWRYLTAEEVAMINRLVAGSSKEEGASRIRREKPQPAAARAPSKPAAAKPQQDRKMPKPEPGPAKAAAKAGSYKEFRSGGRKRR